MISFRDGLNEDHGDKFYCLNGVFHREDGPAMEYASGHKRWFIYGSEYSEQEYLRILNLKAFL